MAKYIAVEQEDIQGYFSFSTVIVFLELSIICSEDRISKIGFNGPGNKTKFVCIPINYLSSINKIRQDYQQGVTGKICPFRRLSKFSELSACDR